jgi:hypothetical protein
VTRALAVVLIGCALVATRPHVVQRYALYLGSAASPQTAHLYLDPFPDRISCESRVATFRANREAAFCAGGPRLEIGSADDAILAADFARLFPPGWYCIPRLRRYGPRPWAVLRRTIPALKT